MKKIVSLFLTVLFAIGALCLTSCGPQKEKTLVVGASSTPHAEILNQCVAAMAQKGYTLTVRVYDDYILPNTATEDGDLDANYFQHTPYLNDFNEKNNTHLVSVAAIHYEPYGLYAGTSSSLTDLPAGAVIAVPNDGTNEARALLLLEAQGLIKLKEGVGLAATKLDIVEDNGYDIKEMVAAVIPTCLDSVNLAVINGNYAIQAGLKIADALAVEDKASTAAQTYANVLVVKAGNENNPAVKALIEVLKTDAIRHYIEETYAGAVVPMF